ncbi:hypothetical protein [Kitasatospora sp. NPDC048407]|uniref:hypothetical protein n=1 Tax=Kitasatospora sp. NPDC048407 TaxID=3364051 RepID=UPI00371DC23C
MADAEGRAGFRGVVRRPACAYSPVVSAEVAADRLSRRGSPSGLCLLAGGQRRGGGGPACVAWFGA